jgi:cyclophilin family peptidyl-prolyl cis-trans isomerase
VLKGGKLGCENISADGGRLTDENLNLRHFKRGQLTLDNSGENSSGSEFLITLGSADMLDGYHQVIGELVEGDQVLNEVEKSLSRLGTFDADIKIEASGTR